MRSLALLLLALPSIAAAQAKVELLPQARVMGGTVLLGEVARIRSRDLDLMRKLVRLPVGAAPQPGEAAVLQRDGLRQWIRRQVKLAPEALEWGGAGETRVLRVARQLRGEDIAWAAVEAARGGAQARFVPRDLDVPEGELRLQARGAEPAPGQRRFVAWVDVWAGDRFVRSVPVHLERADATPVPQVKEATELVREPVAVARGDWATLHSAEGGITLESRVEILQDGRPGQRVRVRQQGVSGALFGRVLGPGHLELAP